MSSEKLDAAIKCIEAGDKTAAVRILAGIVTTDPRNEMAWFWLSKCVEENDRKRYCLARTLVINPNNQNARQELAQLEQPHPAPPKNVSPVPIASGTLPVNSTSVHKTGKVNWTFITAMGIVVLFCFLSIVLLTLIPSINLPQVSVPGIGAGSCNVEDYFKQQSAILNRWTDAEKRANSTARISLTSVIGEMQQIKRDFTNLSHPECANNYHQFVTWAMGDEIDAYLLFMQQADDNSVSAKFANARTEMDAAATELKRIRGIK